MAKSCEICGERSARYVCQECGRSACEFCFVPERWLCVNCYRKLAYRTVPIREIKTFLPLKLFLLGFALIFIGMLVLIFTSLYYVTPSQGAFIWILPFPPVIFGTGEGNQLLTIAMIVLALILLVLFIFLNYRFMRRRLF